LRAGEDLFETAGSVTAPPPDFEHIAKFGHSPEKYFYFLLFLLLTADLALRPDPFFAFVVLCSSRHETSNLSGRRRRQPFQCSIVNGP
jgi:hypothetical protein